MTTTTRPSDSAPVTILDVLIDELRAARTNLHTARAAFEHSPNGDTSFWLAEATARMDALLDAYFDMREG